MPANPSVRYASAPLSVHVYQMSPYVVAQWSGRGPDSTRGAALEAVADVLCREGEQLIHDLGRLSEVNESLVQVLARGITEAQRAGRRVTLVRCEDELFRRLQRAGVGGSVTHAPSLLGATKGLVEESTGSVDMHLRSTPDMLHRLRSVITAVAREANLTDAAEIQLKTAVTEAATNAMLHGSPEGPRNHVRVSFHMDDSVLIIEVADQGRGFDPNGVPPPAPMELRENGYGLHIMRQTMDRVEFFHDEAGMLVRMTKYLGASA